MHASRRGLKLLAGSCSDTMDHITFSTLVLLIGHDYNVDIEFRSRSDG